MKDKLLLIVKARPVWLGFGAVVGALFGEKAAAVVSVISTFFIG
jgi:hypothetical protein